MAMTLEQKIRNLGHAIESFQGDQTDRRRLTKRARRLARLARALEQKR